MNRLSVIILCHENIDIDCVIGCIKAQARDIDEVTVVNDGPSDIADKLKRCGNIRVLQAEKAGNRAYNRNLAAAHSTGDILVFVDGDVLLERGALEILRGRDYDGVSGVCGSVAAMQVTPAEAAIMLKDYDKVDWHAAQDYDYFHRTFPDSRSGLTKLPWNRFYSAVCAIPKDKFYAAGAFDENMTGWGGEDIDMGYRLSFIGNLIFDDKVRGIHIPHPRDQYKNEINSRKNMYGMLAKYRNRDMEELLSFACLDRAHEALEEVLCKMGEVPARCHIRAEKAGELCLNAVSLLHPHGNISYLTADGLKEEAFLGLALPFEDGAFGSSLTDTGIFGYPVGMAARIMQELLRVSPVLFVKKVNSSADISWGIVENKLRHIFCYYKTIQFCDCYGDFDISDDGDRYVITLKDKH